MNPSEIETAYNQITHLWLDKKFNQNNGLEQHLRAINFLKQKDHALDIGCGCTGRMINLLLDHDFKAENIEGVDISGKMIELAKEKHPNICFYQQDICQWTLPKHYDFISAWDSIWHIPLDQQIPVLKKLIAGLNPNGVLIFSCGGTEEEGDQRDNTMGPEVYYSTLGINGFMNLFLGLDCVIRHFEFDQHPELHAYFIIQKNPLC